MWKDSTIEWSYAWEETCNILPRSWRFILLYWKWSHVWHVGVGEKLFHHQVNIVRRHWWHSRCQISHETSDIRLTCTWVCRCLGGSTCSESLPERTCDFEPPEQVPRTSARAKNLRAGSGRTPCVPWSREHQERPAAGREKNAEGPKKHIYIFVQGSPSGCVRSEIPAVTQVEEKGREGNTAVVTAYICWRKHGIHLSWGRNSD